MRDIQIFKAGKHTDANTGRVIEFTQAHIAASCAAYDPAVSEAPFVKGHPKTDKPAHGWVASLRDEAGVMFAAPRQVDPAFSEDVRAGRFKKRSASFYSPDHPNNPAPGVYYLKHVGWLGAVPPAVKGMPDAEFAEPDADTGVLTFAIETDPLELSDYGDLENASLWRRVRDFFLEQFGAEKTDAVIPNYAVANLEEEARKQSQPKDTPVNAFNEEEQRMNEALAAQQAELKKREEALAAQTAAFAEREEKIKTAEAAARRTATVAFVESLVDTGKVLPVHKRGLTEFMLVLGDGIVEFTEGETVVKQSPAEFLRSYLSAQPKLVAFGEHAASPPETHGKKYKAPRGYQVNSDALEIHAKALDYAEQNKTDYITAVMAVSQ